LEGILPAPEGAATLAGYKKLRASGFLGPETETVLMNTGSGFKYGEVL
jgi:threonine synthase